GPAEISGERALLHVRSSPFMPLLFCNARASTERCTLSLHDALPIWSSSASSAGCFSSAGRRLPTPCVPWPTRSAVPPANSLSARSEEHTSELQSLAYLVCRLLLETKTSNALSLLISPSFMSYPPGPT